MSDALPLPPGPNLEQYKKLAKDFRKACESADPDAILQWAARWLDSLALAGTPHPPPRRDGAQEAERIAQRWRKFRDNYEHAAECALSAAQFFIAREHGFASWPKFASHVQEVARAGSPVSDPA